MDMKKESKHFESLQIFTTYSEPMLDEFIQRKDQHELENKHREEEDKLYRKFLEQRREDEHKVTRMEEDEREEYLGQCTREERSRAVNLALRHCRQMLELIYKKKMEYFKKGGEDWKDILAKSYPRDSPKIEPPIYDKEKVYENNYAIFEQVDDTAIKATERTYTSFTNLVRDLVGRSTSDVEKVRAIFRYMSDKKLNFRSWFLYYPEEGNDRGAPTELLRGVEFGIECKALLFKRLCAYAGIHCEIIKGFSKSGSYLPGEEFVDNRYRNTWNAVYVAGGWRLLQSNWAMLSLHSKVARETRQIYQDHYFLTDPDKFIFEFFPSDPEWQLMKNPVTIEEFEDLPLLRSTFFHFELGLEGNLSSVIDCNERGEASIKLLSPPEVAFHYEISFFKSGNTTASVDHYGVVNLDRFLMMSTEEDVTTFQFHAPHKGSYLLDVYAAPYPTFEMCQKQIPIKHINVSRFKINCHSIDKVLTRQNVPLPDCAPGEWGPTKAVKLLGLLPTSHLYPVIWAAPEATVKLEENKPLTLNMEFEMTKPMLDFMIKLRKNDEENGVETPLKNGSGDVKKIRSARYRIKDKKYLMVDVKVPHDGQYGLDIFSREKWEEKMVHCCKYLINCDV